ncbi:uncharacterized protein LOC131331092 [Rhododendron vialii]|uniref:uncharacterized protein LOC131331092 n=1 Tax=Rhododendron vialii TaxID=182163 RepID=UPI00265ECDF1|nr:uncharacterized protein LOC131331092 [Rhododendron vialii]
MGYLDGGLAPDIARGQIANPSLPLLLFLPVRFLFLVPFAHFSSSHKPDREEEREERRRLPIQTLVTPPPYVDGSRSIPRLPPFSSRTHGCPSTRSVFCLLRPFCCVPSPIVDQGLEDVCAFASTSQYLRFIVSRQFGLNLAELDGWLPHRG